MDSKQPQRRDHIWRLLNLFIISSLKEITSLEWDEIKLLWSIGKQRQRDSKAKNKAVGSDPGHTSPRKYHAEKYHK